MSYLLGFVVGIMFSQAANALPYELLDCDKSSYAFSDLKEYSKSELLGAYCTCISTGVLRQNQAQRGLRIREINRELRDSGVDTSKDFTDGVDAYRNQMDIANSNASRILRVLGKQHSIKGAPKCNK